MAESRTDVSNIVTMSSDGVPIIGIPVINENNAFTVTIGSEDKQDTGVLIPFSLIASTTPDVTHTIGFVVPLGMADDIVEHTYTKMKAVIASAREVVEGTNE